MSELNLMKISERFWSSADVRAKTCCWNWRDGKDSNGYGSFFLSGKRIKAPRVAFLLRNGNWPVNNANHNCDNPSCVNPDHIYDGTDTDKDNAADREQRGRRTVVRGESDGRAILTEAKVLEIRRIYKTENKSQSDLAKRFKCSQTNIQHVVSRKTWTHI